MKDKPAENSLPPSSVRRASSGEGDWPLVTVALPVYNAEKYVSQSIECLLGQTFTDFVLLISDNASTDSTGAICQEYARRDERIHYSRNDTNIGMVGNYNLLFSRCKSRYFRWATSDDYWDSDMLQDAVTVMEADSSVGICYSRAIIVDENGNELRRWDDALHLMQDDPAQRFIGVVWNIGLVHHHLGLMRSDVIRKTQMLGPHLASDVGFVAEMSLYGKVFQIPKYQMYRRVHEDSSSIRPNDREHQRRRYFAARGRRVPFSRWRFHLVHFASTKRSPLPFTQKLRIYRDLLRSMKWDPLLFRETLVDLAGIFRRNST